MYPLMLAAQVVALLLMAAVSYWGSTKIDPETRIRARTVALDSTMRSRRTALAGPPIVGLVIVLGTILLNDSPTRVTGAGLGLGVLFVILLAHWSTVKRAAR